LHPLIIGLVGMPGCGKSTIGRQLARMRELLFVDVDHEIEHRLGCAIREFFDREGEDAFRDIEQDVLADVLKASNAAVVATGGGAVLRAENRAALRRSSTVVYLRAMPDDLARRLSRDTHRPLLQVADPRQRLRELYAIRDPLYREVAHMSVDTAHRSAATIVNLMNMQLDMLQAPGAEPETE
jgi:shikimate kinase